MPFRLCPGCNKEACRYRWSGVLGSWVVPAASVHGLSSQGRAAEPRRLGPPVGESLAALPALAPDGVSTCTFPAVSWLQYGGLPLSLVLTLLNKQELLLILVPPAGSEHLASWLGLASLLQAGWEAAGKMALPAGGSGSGL